MHFVPTTPDEIETLRLMYRRRAEAEDAAHHMMVAAATATAVPLILGACVMLFAAGALVAFSRG